MFKKLYDRFKKIIIEEHNFLLFLILFAIVLNIKVPYVISAPGGVIPLSKRVMVDDKYIDSNFYTTYVKVYEGNVATYIVGKIMPKWEVEKESDFTGNTNLSYSELNDFEKLMLKQSNLVAEILAYNEANIEYDKVNSKVYVLYKLDDYENDLKIGDQIVECNHGKVNTYAELTSCVKEVKDDKVSLKVIRAKKDKEITVPLYASSTGNIIGINIYEDFEIKSSKKVEVMVDSSESGSSGGFMTSLAIYDALTDSKLSSGKKIAGTGTIDEDGTVGEIAGLKHKLLGASKKHVDIFFVPKANYNEALKIKEKYNLKIDIVSVEKFNQATNYLMDLKK